MIPPIVPLQAGRENAADRGGAALRVHVQDLRRALRNLNAPLPDPVDHRLKHLFDADRDDSDALAEVEKLLDPLCLVLITINPESRVKATRGAAPARLRADREAVFLIKVRNEAGVTQALRLTGPQVRGQTTAGPNRWLAARVQSVAPQSQELSGRPLEYLLLRLEAYQVGKREATLQFDVGQGTQDLGFRAEAPILFTIQPPQ